MTFTAASFRIPSRWPAQKTVSRLRRMAHQRRRSPIDLPSLSGTSRTSRNRGTWSIADYRENPKRFETSLLGRLDTIQKKFRKHLQTLQQTGEGITDEEVRDESVHNKHELIAKTFLVFTSPTHRCTAMARASPLPAWMRLLCTVHVVRLPIKELLAKVE